MIELHLDNSGKKAILVNVASVKRIKSNGTGCIISYNDGESDSVIETYEAVKATIQTK